ncbi:hypothetical protein ABH944_004813 [Caballeronia udeis]|uniref:Uncharacterized protein n=1 Tax=Caballeronia udeis TaxID=1232866 RepID=A0ABW8MLY0_9BURK
MTDERIFELAELNLGYDRAVRTLDFARAIEREVQAHATPTAEVSNAAGCGRDTERLDFMIEQRVWVQWTLRDGSIRQCQVYDQNEDEEYLVVSGEDRYFNTAREALDAAIESQRSGDGS